MLLSVPLFLILAPIYSVSILGSLLAIQSSYFLLAALSGSVSARSLSHISEAIAIVIVNYSDEYLYWLQVQNITNY